jgi:hypothetical protein
MLVDVCLAIVLDPVKFLEAVMEGYVRLRPSTAVSTPCPANAVAWVEGVVAGRSTTIDGVTLFEVKPVAIVIATPKGYSRALGCVVEMLIAYTRAKAALRYVATANEQRERWCKLLELYASAYPHLVTCVRRVSRNNYLLQLIAKLVREFINLLDYVGCPLPEGLRELLTQLRLAQP